MRLHHGHANRKVQSLIICVLLVVCSIRNDNPIWYFIEHLCVQSFCSPVPNTLDFISLRCYLDAQNKFCLVYAYFIAILRIAGALTAKISSYLQKPGYFILFSRKMASSVNLQFCGELERNKVSVARHNRSVTHVQRHNSFLRNHI